MKNIWNWLVKNKVGKTVIFQRPNAPLILWAVLNLASKIPKDSDIKKGLAALGTAFLFTWAYLEITQGASRFRRLLGFIVAISIVGGLLFRR